MGSCSIRSRRGDQGYERREWIAPFVTGNFLNKQPPPKRVALICDHRVYLCPRITNELEWRVIFWQPECAVAIKLCFFLSFFSLSHLCTAVPSKCTLSSIKLGQQWNTVPEEPITVASVGTSGLLSTRGSQGFIVQLFNSPSFKAFHKQARHRPFNDSYYRRGGVTPAYLHFVKLLSCPTVAPSSWYRPLRILYSALRVQDSFLSFCDYQLSLGKFDRIETLRDDKGSVT